MWNLFNIKHKLQTTHKQQQQREKEKIKGKKGDFFFVLNFEYFELKIKRKEVSELSALIKSENFYLVLVFRRKFLNFII